MRSDKLAPTLERRAADFSRGRLAAHHRENRQLSPRSWRSRVKRDGASQHHADRGLLLGPSSGP
jgi:hypothetical protein